jgi:hypothetical protein
MYVLVYDVKKEVKSDTNNLYAVVNYVTRRGCPSHSGRRRYRENFSDKKNTHTHTLLNVKEDSGKVW